MAGYGGGKAAKVALTEEAIDAILDQMQESAGKMEEMQGKMVKLRNAEVGLLTAFEGARNYMMEMLGSNDPGRENLSRIFGGDCKRIARMRMIIDTANFSEMYKDDQRFPDCRNACESVEKVLEDLGFGNSLRKALDDQKAASKSRKSEVQPEMVAAAVAVVETPVIEEPVIETPVIEEPPAPEPEPPAPEPEPPAPEPPKPEPPAPKPRAQPKKKDLASEALNNTIDESLVTRILACTSCAELAEIGDIDKSNSLGNWMIWMVHRAHLDDPTLEKFDFTNLQMPSGSEEPRISPKLAKAIATNTHITHLVLPNTNLLAAEGGVLAESVAANASLKVLNIDSNFLGQDEMESLANACGTNQTIEELRINNQHGLMIGRAIFEAIANTVNANKFICKLGLNITDPNFRNNIDRSIMRNNDDARKRRVEAKKAAEAAAAAAKA